MTITHISITLDEAHAGTAKRIPLPDGRQAELTIPPGVQNGTRTSVYVSGERYLVEIRVLEHEKLKRQGKDLYCHVQLTKEERKSGAKLRVPAFPQPINITIPPNPEQNATFHIPGAGMPALDNRQAQGDLYVVTAHTETIAKKIEEKLRTVISTIVVLGGLAVIAFGIWSYAVEFIANPPSLPVPVEKTIDAVTGPPRHSKGNIRSARPRDPAYRSKATHA